MNKNILVTSIASKVILINLVKKAILKFDESILLFGADTNKNNIAINFIDNFWEMPNIKNLKIENFINYCELNKIKYIIPTRDEDVKYFSINKQLLYNHNILVFCSNRDSVDFCFDKLKFYQKSDNDFIIPTHDNLNDICHDKIVVKERFGSGSHCIGINLSRENVIEFSKKLVNPVFQPFIKGQEFSVDSYVSENGVCIASIIRSRDLIIDGEAKITTNVVDKKLKKIIISFLEKYKIIGHSVIQVIKSNEQYYIIECNTRFGGASSLSYKLGIESFYWFLQESNRETIRPQIKNKILKQIRIQEDIYFEN